VSEIDLYLTNLSQKLVLQSDLIIQIDTSISYLRSKLWSVFQDKLENVIVFGSYDRGTIIPGDMELDVDIMVLFKQNILQPDTYLNQINNFCQKYYSTSIIYRDRPTITIELNHIKFELVPAYRESEDEIKIPAKKDDNTIWRSTFPEKFKNTLFAKDESNTNFIIPSIRLFKYWNLLSGKPFLPFYLEKHIVDSIYYFIFTSPTLEGYFIDIAEKLHAIATTNKQKESVNLLHTKIKALQKAGNPSIETELAILLPLFS
jgi:predicted nucleotidyltransferase